MFRHGTQTFTQYHLPDHLGVDNEAEGKVVNPMCMVKLAKGLGADVDVDITEYTLYSIVNSTTKVVDNVEKPIAAIPGSKTTYLYSVNRGPGCTLAALAGFTVPENKDKSGAFYCKYTVDFTDLAVHNVDMIKLNDSIKYHWSVNTENEYYRNHLCVAPYKLAVVTSSVKTTKFTTICVELVWIESVDGDILNGKTYTDDSKVTVQAIGKGDSELRHGGIEEGLQLPTKSVFQGDLQPPPPNQHCWEEICSYSP